MNKKAKKRNLVSILLTIIVITIYLIPSLSLAVSVDVQTDKEEYTPADTQMEVDLTITIQPGERIPVEDLFLISNGIPICEFDVDGSYDPLDCPNVISITQTETETGSTGTYSATDEGVIPPQEVEFGYGYGYGYGEGYGYTGTFTYHVLIDITGAPADTYVLELDVYTEEDPAAYIFSGDTTFDIISDSDGDGYAADVDCDDDNENIYPGTTRTYGINTGACEYGIETCTDGIWVVTTPSIDATTEILNNGIDEDCDGKDAECDATHGCPATNCNKYDGCAGNDYNDYNNMPNTCLADNTCQTRSCTSYTTSYNDARCTECQTDSDCASRDYCSGVLIKHDEGKCVNYDCEAVTTTTYDCSGDDYDTDNYCNEVDNDVYIDHVTYTCDAATVTCKDTTTPEEIEDCVDGCEDGECIDNTPPTITSTPVTTATETMEYTYQVTVTDTEQTQEMLWFSVDSPTLVLSIGNDANSRGKISFTPAAAGTHEITVTVSDGWLEDTQTYTLTIEEFNNAPDLDSIGPLTARENELFEKTVTATDADGDTLTFSDNTDLFDISSGGAISFTPEAADVGEYTITIKVSDGVKTDEETITFTVLAEEIVNTAPSITAYTPLEDVSITELEQATFTVTAEDAESTPSVLWYLDSAQAGTGNSYTFVGDNSMDGSNAGVYTVKAVASDGELLSQEQTWTLTVIRVKDTDEDGIADDDDNCLFVYNPDQADTGGDPGVGDACDGNIDGDLVDDEEDFVAGTADVVDSNVEDLGIEIGGDENLNQVITGTQPVSFTTTFVDEETQEVKTEPVVNFDFDFTEETTLDLSKVEIKTQPEEAEAGEVIVKGIDLSAQGKTKTIYMDRKKGTDTICIKDAEIASVKEISVGCDGEDEVLLSCPGTSSGYTCTVEVDKYKVEGLVHSGVIESKPNTAPDAVITISDQTVYVGDELEFTGYGTDAEDKIVAYEWNFYEYDPDNYDSKIIFVTENTYAPEAFEGLNGADKKCQKEADDAELTGRFKAFLSTASKSAGSELKMYDSYKLTDGTTIGSLLNVQNKIDKDAKRNSVTHGEKAVTLTRLDSGYSSYGGSDCNDWESNSGYVPAGEVGRMNPIHGWSSWSFAQCSEPVHLYCLQQTNINNGIIEDDKSPQLTLTKPGTYNIEFRVKDARGMWSSVDSVQITVSEPTLTTADLHTIRKTGLAEAETTYRGKTLKVRSAGWYDAPGGLGGATEFYIGDTKIVSKITNEFGRGFNIMVLNPDDFTIKYKKRFDTYDAGHGTAWDTLSGETSRPCYDETKKNYDCDVIEMANFIYKDIKTGDIVLAGVQDDGARRLTSEAKAAIKSLGGNVDSLGIRDSYALVGIKADTSCSSDAECDDGDDLTLYDTCNNPGTDGYCSYKGIACLKDTHCPDDPSNTYNKGKCVDPGEFSTCSYKQVECVKDDDCKDYEYKTAKYCSGNDVNQDYVPYKCSAQFECVKDTKITSTLETCDYKCESGECVDLTAVQELKALKTGKAQVDVTYKNTDLRVMSAGWYEVAGLGGATEFQIGSKVIRASPGNAFGRGFNVMVLDKDTLAIKAQKRFDTWSAGSPTAWSGARPCYDETKKNYDCDVIEMTNFINSISTGDIVLVAVMDDGSRRLNNGAKAAIKSLGGNVDSLGSRGSYALIGIKSASSSKSNAGCNDYDAHTEDTYTNGYCSYKGIACLSNAECGANTWTGARTCSGNKVYQDFITYTCVNAPTTDSYCALPSTRNRLRQNCYDSRDMYVGLCSNGACYSQKIACSRDSNCPDDSSAYTRRKCVNPGALNAKCTQVTIQCLSNADCKEHEYTTAKYCSGNDVKQDYVSYKCSAEKCAKASPVTSIIETCNYKCENGACVALEKKAAFTPVEGLKKRATGRVQVETAYNGASLKVVAGGFEDAVGEFYINGQKREYYKWGGWVKRGFNIVVLDKDTLNIIDRKNFDTYADCLGGAGANKMATFINSIPRGNIVLVSVVDSGERHFAQEHYPSLNEYAYSALESLGAAKIRDLGFRDSYAFIGVKE